MLYTSSFDVFLKHSIIMSIIYENIMAITVNEKRSKLRKLDFTFKGAKTYGFHPWGTQYNHDQEVLQNFILGTRRKKYDEVFFL